MKNNLNMYQFEVLVNNVPVREYEHKSEVYIEGRKGSDYTLRFKNNTANRVLAVMSIDGISVMDNKPASRDSNGYVIGAWQSVDVPGWRLDDSKVASFKFCPQGEREDKTYVESLKSAGFEIDVENQGVIGCKVFIEKCSTYYNPLNFVPYPYSYPYYTGIYYTGGVSVRDCCAQGAVAPSMSYNMMNQSPSVFVQETDFSQVAVQNTSLGTGFGDDKKFETYSVSFNKQDYESWTAVIFYDTLLNLKKKGVIIEKKNPNPFPRSNPRGCYDPR
jgi:hypothetical protein